MTRPTNDPRAVRLARLDNLLARLDRHHALAADERQSLRLLIREEIAEHDALRTPADIEPEHARAVEPGCRWPHCLPEGEQRRLADEVMAELRGEPSVRQCAADDAAHWDAKYAGEGQ